MLAPGYNLSYPMEPDLQSFETALEAALSSRLQEEATRLGRSMRPARIAEVSRLLLGITGERKAEPGAFSSPLPAAAGGEDELEPHDYLHLVPEEMRRALGQVVTPGPIVRYILNAAEYREEADILEQTLCDPACGSGAFLAEAVRIYLGALRKAAVPPEEWYPRVRDHIAGIDIDPIACLYARFNLSLLLSRSLLLWMAAHPRRLPEELRLDHRDTLTALASELGGDLLEERDSRPSLTGAFDFVVGNPPYRKLGQMSPTLRQAFQDSIYGHPNAYGLFLHAGLEMLRPGGRLGFIVPRSMLSGLYFQNLRRLLEEKTHLQELTLLADRKRVFPQVLQGTMILVFQKRSADGRRSGSRTVRTAVVRAVAELSNGGPAQVSPEVTQVVRRLNGTTVWFVSDRSQTYSVLNKILDRHPLLASPAVGCPARTGPIVWNRLKPDLRPQAGAGTLPLIWATDVSRFHFELATAGDSRPPYLEETAKTRGLATVGPSLLIQRVTADEQARRIVASRVSFPARRRYFVENHLNMLQPATADTRMDLRFLLGVLSSDVIEFLFRSMNGNTQVSATELNLLPIARGGFEREIAELVAALEETTLREKRANLEGELNERVAHAYSLTAGDLKFLQRILRENPAVQEPRRDA